MFEDQAQSIAALSANGLPPLKVQYSAAPYCQVDGSLAGVKALCAMDEQRFCHQVGIRYDDQKVEVLADLPELFDQLEQWKAGSAPLPKAVCTHFHIPVNQPPSSPYLISSIDESRQGLAAALQHGAQHISVETYTWSLQADSDVDMRAGTAAELRHLASELRALGVSLSA